MSVFLVSRVTVRDPAAFEVYRTRAAASIAAHGGRYLVRGGSLTALEGDLDDSTLVIVEFPSRDVAERWYASPEYARALDVRDQALVRTLVLVDGVRERDDR